MLWFGKSFIIFCKSFINLIKVVSTQTYSLARVRGGDENHPLLRHSPPPLPPFINAHTLVHTLHIFYLPHHCSYLMTRLTFVH